MRLSTSSFETSLSWFDRVKQALHNEPQDKEQLMVLLRDAQQRDLLSADTLTMIEGAVQVSEMHVRDVMIPRAQMVCLELYAPLEELVKTIVDSGHSRFPVIDDNRDDIQGIFLAKDLLVHYDASKDRLRDFKMRDAMRPAVFIPESKRLNILLRDFRTSRNHMAIVVDEYSGVAGLVTIEDVIEQIVGEIDDEHDVDDQVFIRPTHHERYLVKALTPIEDFNEYFRTNFSDDEVDTIGGVVMQTFGHLPKRGETLELNGFHFEVARATGRRIHLLRVKPMGISGGGTKFSPET
jgi:magnesium and cobalt transporter